MISTADHGNVRGPDHTMSALPGATTLPHQPQRRPGVKFFVVFFFALLFLGASLQAWPTTAQWLPVYRGGAIVFDSNTDTNGSRNIVGTATSPSLFLNNDGIYLHFRLRLDSSPAGSGGQGLLQAFGWGVIFDTNMVATNFEWLIMVDGIDKNESILLQHNTVQGTINDPGDKTEALVYTLGLAGNYQINVANTAFNGDQDYFLDWRIPYDVLKQYTGLLDNSPLRIFGGASSSAQSLTENGGDLLGAADLLNGFSDYTTLLGTTPTTGTLRFVADLAGNGDVTIFSAGDRLYLRVADADQNSNATGINTVAVTLTSLGGDVENIVLAETGVNTGVFTGSIMTMSAPAVTLNDGSIQVTSATVVSASYIDGIDATLLRNQARTDSVANAAPMISLTKAVSHDSAPPGSEIIYSIAFRNAGAAPAHTVVIMDSVPAFTRYVPGSLRLGLGNSSYDAAAVLTDVADADAGTLNGNQIMFLIHSVAADNGVAQSGPDEGKVFFKVVIE